MAHVCCSRAPAQLGNRVVERLLGRRASEGIVRHAPALLLASLMAMTVPQSWADEGPIGLAAGGSVIEVTRVAAQQQDAPTVLLVGGLAGADASSQAVADAAAEYAARSAEMRSVHLLAVPVANPEGAELTFPPQGDAYVEHAESHVLWRWTGLNPPDLVLIAGRDDVGLAAALSSEAVAGVGPIPARRVEPGSDLLSAVPSELGASRARIEIERRVARSPLEVARLLAPIYGQSFDIPAYISGMGLIAHLRLGNRVHVEGLVAPYVDGRRDSFDNRRFGLSLYLAGHLVFAALAERTGNAAYVDRVRAAADFAFDSQGNPLEAMPEHGEMSDSIFMGASILAAAGELTGERRYLDMAARHIEFMNALLLRDDGLYRHSPLTEAAWGRGNGFASIGYALTLSAFPAEHPAYERLLSEYRDLMKTLAGFQNADGTWRQVVDHPGAYHETSATAIIGFSMQRGLVNGWLDSETFEPVVRRAWQAVAARTSEDGVFIDVAESTNKQSSLRDYLLRRALFGRDERTGGMVMLFASEMAEGI